MTTDVGQLPAFLHFGFRFSDPDAVRALLGRLRADGIPIVEEYDEPTYVGSSAWTRTVEVYCHPQ